MEITKHLKLDSIFLFLFLVLFPFGQIIRIGIVQPIDVVTGLAMIYSIIKKLEEPEFFKYLKVFLFIASFSWIFSIFTFFQIEVLYGLLYLFRLWAYFYFSVYVYNFVKKDKKNKELLVSSLLVVSILSAVFGWLQFFFFPDLKPFFVWGWDMHLFRLTGTFLDPTFLGLIIVFGVVIAIYKKNWLASVFLLVSLIFTYSRASYLAFAFAITSIVFLNKKLRKLLLLLIALPIIVISLPTTKNQSISFFRTFSIFARMENYQNTIKIFTKSPVFGVGYNNMCISFRKYIGYQDFSSHACSGSDSSLLFILATTGILGLITFIFSGTQIAKLLKESKYIQIILPITMALFIHGFFGNSFFYSWIMGYMVILLTI